MDEPPANLSNQTGSSQPSRDSAVNPIETPSFESFRVPGEPSENGPGVPGPGPTGDGERPTTHIRVTATIRTNQAPQQQPTNNNNGELPQQTQNLFLMRDRLFLALFFRVSLIYARTVPKTLRRIFEFCLLMQSLVLLFTLA